MRTSPAGLRFIQQAEGLPNGGRPYPDPLGFATVGYGHLLRPGPLRNSDFHARWVAGQHTPGVLTPAEAAVLLVVDLAHDYEPTIRALFAREGPLHGLWTQRRFDALVSFAFNLGVGSMPHREGTRWVPSTNFERIGGAIISRDVAAIARTMPLYSNPHDPRVHAGLLRRREAEARMFLTPGRFEDFTALERRLIVDFDRLRGHTSAAAALLRAQLQVQMRARSAVIERAALFHGGWRLHRRGARHAALSRRGNAAA